MKIKRTALGLLAALLLTLPTVVQAQLLFTTFNDAVTITGYSGSPTSVVIPNTINGYPVISIRDSAFAFCPSLTTVTIPSSIKSIGDSAFDSCHKLVSVTIPNGVTSIGSSAFYTCSNLVDVTLPAVLPILEIPLSNFVLV